MIIRDFVTIILQPILKYSRSAIVFAVFYANPDKATDLGNDPARKDSDGGYII